MEKTDILVLDIETDSLNVNTAKVKWFGAYSYLDGQYYLLKGFETEKINNLIRRHSVIVSFNGIDFDIPILEKNGFDFMYKNQIDLLQISKKRLPSMKPGCPNFKLKTICEFLVLDEFGKGDIDYRIFQKDKWTKKEEIEIKKYLKQDLVLTKKLYNWYAVQFEPLKKYLSIQDQHKLMHIKTSIASLSYRVICNLAGLTLEWSDKKPLSNESFEGGHHIELRKNKLKGEIVSVDFVSAYPHAIMMNNLISKTKEFGKIEESLKKIFLERLKAKQEGDKIKSLAYKIIINSFYGLLGNYAFKTLYQPSTAGETTHIVRNWLKKLAKTLEENGFYVIYGFTDNVMVEIPPWSSKEQLKIITDKFIEDVKSEVPFPMDSFKLELEKEMKFIWFVAKNCYLWVDKNDEVGYKSTLLNSNTPKIILELFEKYISPKIVNKLDVDFTESELKIQLIELLKKDLSSAAEEFNVEQLDNYKSRTSLQYQISQRYGSGKHTLIPNTSGVGVGRSNKLRYCTLSEFREHNLTEENISIERMLKYLKPFYNDSGKVLDLNSSEANPND